MLIYKDPAIRRFFPHLICCSGRDIVECSGFAFIQSEFKLAIFHIGRKIFLYPDRCQNDHSIFSIRLCRDSSFIAVSMAVAVIPVVEGITMAHISVRRKRVS